jgi:hypothetical protein
MGHRREILRAWLVLFAVLATTPATAQTDQTKVAAIDYLGRGKAANSSETLSGR